MIIQFRQRRREYNINIPEPPVITMPNFKIDIPDPPDITMPTYKINFNDPSNTPDDRENVIRISTKGSKKSSCPWRDKKR